MPLLEGEREWKFFLLGSCRKCQRQNQLNYRVRVDLVACLNKASKEGGGWIELGGARYGDPRPAGMEQTDGRENASISPCESNSGASPAGLGRPRAGRAGAGRGRRGEGRRGRALPGRCEL